MKMKKSKRWIICIVLSIAFINILYSIPYSFAHSVEGIGHRLEMMVHVDQAQKAHLQQPESSSLNKTSKAFFGISIILFMTSLFIWLNAKKIIRKTAGKQQ